MNDVYARLLRGFLHTAATDANVGLVWQTPPAGCWLPHPLVVGCCQVLGGFCRRTCGAIAGQHSTNCALVFLRASGQRASMSAHVTNTFETQNSGTRNLWQGSPPESQASLKQLLLPCWKPGE